MSIPYVSDAARARADVYAARLAELPAQAGVLFVSVKAQPELDGAARIFCVVLGMSRLVGTAVGRPLLESLFEEDIAAGVQFTLFTTDGIIGAAAAR